MIDKQKFDEFIKEYKELCIKHNIYLEVSENASIEAWRITDNNEFNLNISYIANFVRKWGCYD